jgi:hypothetical protein
MLRSTSSEPTVSIEADSTDTAAPQENFIPVRKTDIQIALARTGYLPDPREAEKFAEVCRLLGSLFHYEYFERLETLRNDYYYFNPDVADPAPLDPAGSDRARAEFVATLVDVLQSASFIEVPRSEVEEAHGERHMLTVQIETKMDEYREVRIFRRGQRSAEVKVPIWFGWRSTEVSTVVYDQIVLVMAVKPKEEITSEKTLERLARRHTRPAAFC